MAPANDEEDADNETGENANEEMELRHREVVGRAMEGVDVNVVKPSMIIQRVKDKIGRYFDETMTKKIMLEIMRATPEYIQEIERMNATEKARQPKMPQEVSQPTPAERARHEVTHAEFKSWCRHCMEGKGRDHVHRSIDRIEDTQPIIGLDFFFPGTEHIQRQGNLKRE